MADPLLMIDNLAKSFGALKAVDDVTLDVRASEIHAVIGPNGAGKSTLVNLITGLTAPDSGRVKFLSRDMTHTPPPERALLGLARTFQISNLITNRTARENIMLAIQSRQARAMRFWRPFTKDPALLAPANALLGRIGLGTRGDILVAELSHGERRLLELGVALAMEPRVLLLDEPMAGLGPEDAAGVVVLLDELRASHGILLIEHDMDAVFALADRISVLVYGALLITGTPDQIRSSDAVRDAYLGDAA